MIQKRQTKKGARYDVRVRDSGGRVHNKTFRSKDEARRYENKAIAERDRGGWIDPRNGTIRFSVVAQAWLASNPGKRPSTVARDRSTIERRLLPVLGERHIGAITATDISSLVSTWTTALSPATVQREYGTLRAIFGFAVDSDYIVRTPCRRSVVKLPGAGNQHIHHVISPDELKRLSEAMGERYGAMALLGAVLGLRWGEVAGLQVRSVDFLRKSVVVTQAVARDGHGRTFIGPPKSKAAQRRQSAPTVLVEALAALVATFGLEADDLLFGQLNGEPLDASNFRRQVWRPAVEKVGLPGPRTGRQKLYGFHDLRRANATVLVTSDVDLKTAQTRMGHSDPRLTIGVYAQRVSAADRLASDALGAHFLPQNPDRGAPTEASA